MIKQSPYLKLYNLIFLILLFFPLFHFWGEGRMFMKPVFFSVIGLIGLVLFSKDKMAFKSIWTSLLIMSFALLVILQFYFKWNVGIIPYLFLLALFLFYKIVITFLAINEKTNKKNAISTLYIVMIGIEITYLVLPKKNISFYFFPNDSIFSILLAAQLLLITPYLKKYNENFVKNKILSRLLSICYLLLCFCLLFYTKGKGGILGFTIAICILNYSYLKLKIGYFKGIIIFSGLLVLLLTYKSNSSGGRLLIYKVITTQLEPEELITGIGYGRFKVKYNDLQAQYFSKESINSKEALLANNTNYMFNDPLQLIIETGLIGLILLSILATKLFFLFKRNYISLKERPILCGAYLSVICIIISSLFSYPFQITGILLHFLFCIAIIINEDNVNKLHPIPLQKKHIIFSRTSLLSLIICFLFFGQESFKFYIKLNDAIKYSNIGFRKKAIQTYYKISDNSIQDRDVLYNYADELAKTNKIDSALVIINKALNYLNNDKSAILMGNLLQEKGIFLEAEKQYKKAIFINPKLFANRASLFKFYCETKQYEKAIYWGNSILEMPVKIPSKTINDIKNETNIMMSGIKETPLD